MIYQLYNDCFFDFSSSCFYFEKKPNDIKNNMVDTLLYNRKKIIKNNIKNITTLNLLPTMLCDGLCSYCYNTAYNNNNNHIMMDVNILHQSLQKIQKDYIINLNQIKIYGGEPFLNTNLKDIVFYLKKQYNNILFYISSGLLFSDNVFEKMLLDCMELKKHNIDFVIGVSVDFGTTVDTFTRVNKHNLTQQDILDRTNILYEQGISVRYATVVTKNTDLNILKEDIIKHCNKYYKESDMVLDTSKIQYAHRISIASDDELYPSLDQVHSLYQIVFELYKKYPVTSNLFPYTDVIKSSNILKINDSIFMLAYEPFYCGIYTDMLTIKENGDIINCHMHPDKYIELTENKYKEIFEDETCLNCNFFLVCRGACPNRKIYSPKSKNVYCQWIKYSYILGLERLKLLFPEKEDLLYMLNNEKSLVL